MTKTSALDHLGGLLIGILAVNVFPKDTTARFGQVEHRTSKLMIVIGRANALNYAAAGKTLITVFQRFHKQHKVLRYIFTYIKYR